MFDFVADSDVGDVYIVVDASARPPSLGGGLSTRACEPARELEWADLPKACRWALFGSVVHAKLELLSHLPSDVHSAVLLDADVYVMRDGMRVLRDHIRSLSSGQFLAAPRTDARVRMSGKETARRLASSPLWGINSGVLALDVIQMRAFVPTFVLVGAHGGAASSRPSPRATTVWEATRRCGTLSWWSARTLATTAVLDTAKHRCASRRGRANRHATGVNVCTARPSVASGFTLTPDVDIKRLLDDQTFDSCRAADQIEPNDDRFGPVPRAVAAWPQGPQSRTVPRVCSHLRASWRLLSADRHAERRRLLAIPLAVLRLHQERRRGSVWSTSGTPKGNTGCHALRFEPLKPRLLGESSAQMALPQAPTLIHSSWRRLWHSPPPKAAFVSLAIRARFSILRRVQVSCVLSAASERTSIHFLCSQTMMVAPAGHTLPYTRRQMLYAQL